MCVCVGGGIVFYVSFFLHDQLQSRLLTMVHKTYVVHKKQRCAEHCRTRKPTVVKMKSAHKAEQSFPWYVITVAYVCHQAKMNQ